MERGYLGSGDCASWEAAIRMTYVRINVATDNPVKVRAVEEAFREIFPDADPVVGRVPGPGPAQPIGDQTLVGAISRAQAAIRTGEPDFGVGIEAGIIRFPRASGWFAVQACAIIDRQGKLSLGLGPGFAIPEKIVDPILAGEEMRDVIRRVYRLTEKEVSLGLIHHLSSGRIDRAELTKQAVMMALLPWSS